MPPLQQIDLAISGMSCASCVTRVEKALQRVPGVANASVNLATEQARVEAAGGVELEALIAAVRKGGYGAALATDTAPARDKWEAWRLAAGFTLGAPVFLAMALPVPGLLQLVLAGIVQIWLGGRFYKGGLAALRAGGGNMDVLVALGTSAAFGLSVWNFAAAEPLYFEILHRHHPAGAAGQVFGNARAAGCRWGHRRVA